MNYVWQELCRQRNALARLMLGSLPREDSAARAAALVDVVAAWSK